MRWRRAPGHNWEPTHLNGMPSGGGRARAHGDGGGRSSDLRVDCAADAVGDAKEDLLRGDGGERGPEGDAPEGCDGRGAQGRQGARAKRAPRAHQ